MDVLLVFLAWSAPGFSLGYIERKKREKTLTGGMTTQSHPAVEGAWSEREKLSKEMTIQLQPAIKLG